MRWVHTDLFMTWQEKIVIYTVEISWVKNLGIIRKTDRNSEWLQYGEEQIDDDDVSKR